MNKKLALAVLIASFLVGDAYGESEAYYCSDTQSGGFNDYNKKSGSYSLSLNELDRFKMNYDKDSGFIQLFLDSVPPEAPIEFRKPKFHCQHRPDFPEIQHCLGGLSRFDFNTKNGKFVQSSSASIALQGFPITISYGTCEKF
jgi:hypothetical protein